MLRHAMLPLVLAAQVGGPAPAPGTIPFRVHPLDTSLCETAAVVDGGHGYGVLWFEHRTDGRWTPHVIDSTWALAHASALADLNGDGRPDLITGKRAQARGPEGSEKEPLVLYWYESRAVAARGTAGSLTWSGSGT